MSEPQRLGEVLPEVLENIKARCNKYRMKHGLSLLEEDSKNNHKAKIISAVSDFMSSKEQKRGKQWNV